MLCFPQLLTGALSQYPIGKRTTYRTIRNRCMDGREIKLADAAATTIEWTLTFQELIDAEIEVLRDFFLSMEGNLGTFTFLDPTDNLLTWSEKFDEAAWQKDPLLQLSAGATDPFGGSSAFRLANPAGAPLQLRQTLNVPDGYYYALSVWVRSLQGGEITLVLGSERKTLTVEHDWKRLVFAGTSTGNANTAEFGIEVAPGMSADLFGAQAEAQIGASTYKKTTCKGGTYPVTRFVDEGLILTSPGPNRNGCVVHLRSR